MWEVESPQAWALSFGINWLPFIFFWSFLKKHMWILPLRNFFWIGNKTKIILSLVPKMSLLPSLASQRKLFGVCCVSFYTCVWMCIHTKECKCGFIYWLVVCSIFCFLFFCGFFSRRFAACGFFGQGLNPGPWQWKCPVLTSGPPGNSLFVCFFIS